MISLAGVAAGLRFFPRYYFQLLPVMVLIAARGFTLLGRKRALAAALLLLVPLARFGPSYLTALSGAEWRDTAMDRDSRAAAALTRQLAKPGDTLFVWGYRPEIYVYTQLPAATMFLDSQPLTGVPGRPAPHPIRAGGNRSRARAPLPVGALATHIRGGWPKLLQPAPRHRELPRAAPVVRELP